MIHAGPGPMALVLAAVLSFVACIGPDEGSLPPDEGSARAPEQRQWVTGLEVHYELDASPASFAIVALDYSSWGPPPYEKVVLALWESGRLILSRNPRDGGAPFDEYACPPEKVRSLLGELLDKATECAAVAPTSRPGETPPQLVVVQQGAQRIEVWAYHPFRMPQEPRIGWDRGPEAARFEPLFDGLVEAARAAAAGCPGTGEPERDVLVGRKAPLGDPPASGSRLQR